MNFERTIFVLCFSVGGDEFGEEEQIDDLELDQQVCYFSFLNY